MAMHTGGIWYAGTQQRHGTEVRAQIDGIRVSIGWFGIAFTAGLGGSYSVTESEALANARLFSAAPEMLAALQELRYASTDKAEAMADAAIAKALNMPPNVGGEAHTKARTEGK